MLLPILFCVGALCCGSSPKASSSSSSSRRPVPRRNGGDRFDAALCHAMRRGYDAERTVAYVLRRAYPGRENDRELARAVTAKIHTRLSSPGYRANCGGR